MSIGHRIIDEIAKQGMFVVNFPDPDAAHVFVWSSGAAEQLEALVAQYQGELERHAHELAAAVQAFRNLSQLGRLTRLRSTPEYAALCEAWRSYNDFQTQPSPDDEAQT